MQWHFYFPRGHYSHRFLTFTYLHTSHLHMLTHSRILSHSHLTHAHTLTYSHTYTLTPSHAHTLTVFTHLHIHTSTHSHIHVLTHSNFHTLTTHTHSHSPHRKSHTGEQIVEVLALNRGGVTSDKSRVNRDTLQQDLSLESDGDLHVVLAFAEKIRPNTYIDVLGDPQLHSEAAIREFEAL